MKPALLVLEDGETFSGEAWGSGETASGEVVFNTGMTGYQEVLTDPSYQGQIVVMTYPHIGNYGVNEDDPESEAPRVSGFVIRSLPAVWSSWRASGGLEEYLESHGISAITEVDTRRLTRHLRRRGAMRGVVSSSNLNPAELAELARQAPSTSESDLVQAVTAGEPYRCEAVGEARYRVAAYDFGIKRNILRRLSESGCEVSVFRARTPASDLLEAGPDGVLFSNGPGDPTSVGYAVGAIRDLLGRVPVFGICLGHQLLALALGLPTYKLRFGHHGVNHPVARLSDGRVEITTQNHNFAVEEGVFGYTTSDGRPRPGLTTGTPYGGVELTHVNLNDHTVEGFRLLDVPAFSVQYHPEAGPGPHDSRYLFDRFVDAMGGGEAVGQR